MNKNAALKNAYVLRKKLGTMWVINVWENLGWHYSIKLIIDAGYIEIFPRKNGEYWIDSRLPEQIYVYAKDPTDGVKELIKKAKLNAEQFLKIVNLLEKLNMEKS